MLTHTANIAAIRRHPILSALNDAQFEQLRAHLSIERHAAQQFLFQAGDPARHFFIVLEGQIRLLVQSRSGQEKIVDVIHAGGTFAEALMFLEAPRYPVSAQAAEESLVLGVASAPFHAVLRESTDTCLRLLADLSVRLHQLVGEIERLTLSSAMQRFVQYLLEQLPAVGPAPQVVLLRESRQDLASLLGMKPETLSRILRTLSDAGIIRVDGREVLVPDVTRLREVVDRLS
jgi:CRP/FNR family transcriptional regulator, dissimilatory nitrate respiration regulator